VTVARNRWRTRDIDSSTSSSQIACATGVAGSAFTVIAAPILEPFNGKGRIPHATVGDKIGGTTWTNASIPASRSSLPGPESLPGKEIAAPFPFGSRRCRCAATD
jgi:hypothetical protein